MQFNRSISLPGIAAALLAAVVSTASANAQAQPASPVQKVDFARDVLPVFRAHCFQCHAGSESQGGLKLDSRQALLKGGASGTSMVPGQSGKSLLLSRIMGQGGKPRMPLGFAPLSDSQTAVIKAWLDQGAPWPAGAERPHWAYVKPTKSALPAVHLTAWPKSPIDRFILAKIEKAGLRPSAEADKVTLLRRVTLDLTGLPPTPAEVDAFIADKSPNAYEKVVDRLFASPHYGERMALPWLDAARYADSNGFQQDGDTYQYVWRDWVVKALNSNMPFDQFTIQQLAGDLLPNATVDQKVATGFNRCHLLNGEGGAIAEEQRNVILFDRVDVTATTWLAATLACAQCHDHKYDPLSRKDYYSFMAFFNNVPESGVPPFGGQYRIADPFITVPTEEENSRLKDLDLKLADINKQLASAVQQPAAQEALAKWMRESAASPVAPSADVWQLFTAPKSADFNTAFNAAVGPETRLSKNAALTLNGPSESWSAHPEWADGKVYVLNGETTAFYLFRHIHSDTARQLKLSFGSDDGMKAWLNGEQIVSDNAQRAALPDQDVVTVTLRAGTNDLLVKIVNGGGIGGFYFKMADSTLPADLQALLKKPARTATEEQRLADYYFSTQPPAGVKELNAQKMAFNKQIADIKAAMPRVMVMSDAQPRKTHLLLRGNYEMPAEEVACSTPECLPAMPASAPRNRLGLAQWLVSPDNPLTARVQVNRYWQLFFGVGLVKTSENLGTQCDPPSHPALLDWLASDFVSSGWNVKRLQRMIVTSATYRQSSRVTRQLLQKDPENRLYAHAARFRMPSLLLRDIALSASGLLNPKIGGKPVYPYQPKGIWDGLAITNERDFSYPQSTGADLYRRSLYTFWRRTVAPANMFDASVRQTCKVRLTVTSTPLHALTTLNDVTWVEAGRALAQRVIKQVPGTDARLTEAFRLVCARRPTADELKVLRRGLERAMAAYRADGAAAEAFLKAGDSPRDASIPAAEHAAYASVCLSIFNLDEALTRE
jgi:mono/diheme cytochrome c family protein